MLFSMVSMFSLGHKISRKQHLLSSFLTNFLSDQDEIVYDGEAIHNEHTDITVE